MSAKKDTVCSVVSLDWRLDAGFLAQYCARYVVPFGIKRGVLMLLTIARKIAVNCVRFWLLGALA